MLRNVQAASAKLKNRVVRLFGDAFSITAKIIGGFDMVPVLVELNQSFFIIEPFLIINSPEPHIFTIRELHHSSFLTSNSCFYVFTFPEGCIRVGGGGSSIIIPYFAIMAFSISAISQYDTFRSAFSEIEYFFSNTMPHLKNNFRIVFIG